MLGSSLLLPAAPSRRPRAALRTAALLCLFSPLPLAADSPARVSFAPAPLEAIEHTLRSAVAAGRIPGAVVHLEREGESWQRAIGWKSLEPARIPTTTDTPYDLASLTKVVATATAIQICAQRGLLSLDDPVSRHLPDFQGQGRETITLRQLLTHSSGLRAGLPPEGFHDAVSAISSALTLPPASPPLREFRYSDVNFILLGHLLETVTGKSLDAFCQQEIFTPLGMTETSFRRIPAEPGPATPAADAQRFAPTEILADGTILQGIVHDPTARRMQGVAGHAGLFSTAADLARFCRLFLPPAENPPSALLSAASLQEMTRPHNPPGLPQRGLGWDLESPYTPTVRGRHFPAGGFGHSGWTGTSLWICPTSRAFLILLTNRNHPTPGDDQILPLRTEIASLAAQALGLAPYDPSPKSPSTTTPRDSSPPAPSAVLNGIDVLARSQFRRLAGLRIGLVTHACGHDRHRTPTIDLLHRAPQVDLRALFGPEHGIRSDLDQKKIADSRDPATGLPIHSLYGENRHPTAAQLRDLDALVIDLQDVGCRFYTYLSTLVHCMEAAATHGKRVIVLDRQNPIGPTVEGPPHTEPASFIGIHDIPLRHGMTLGELALLIRAERGWQLDLEIVPCAGRNPLGWFDESAQPWTHPSPNLRNPTAALLYPGVAMIEFSRISVGRGTDSPFECLGAPWIPDDVALAATLSAARLPGLRFTPVLFTPTSSVFAGETCRGVRITVTDRSQVSATTLGLLLAETLQKIDPKAFQLAASRKLIGHDPTLQALLHGQSHRQILPTWQPSLQSFHHRRHPHLLYPR